MEPAYDDLNVATMRRLVDRSRRSSGAQLPVPFARRASGGHPPLARLIQGGRGGEVRLKLYLSTVLLAGGPAEHRQYGANAVVDVSARAWARALALPDPDGRGARRVSEAQGWLHRYKFLDVERRPGREPIVRLLSADGAGRRWVRPTQPYITVPLALWDNHWIWVLEATDLAVLIALLDLAGGRVAEDRPNRRRRSGPARTPAAGLWMTPEERSRYGFSDDTWRKAPRRLADLGLVETEMVTSASRDFETPRRHRTYRVVFDRLDADALSILVGQDHQVSERKKTEGAPADTLEQGDG
jgi:hypothetical protein